MSDERLAELENLARGRGIYVWSRNNAILELIAEVRRLRALLVEYDINWPEWKDHTSNQPRA